jgi:hypothetical protein
MSRCLTRVPDHYKTPHLPALIDADRPRLFCRHDREFKGNILARQLSVDRRERVKLVLERSRVLRVEKPEIV